MLVQSRWGSSVIDCWAYNGVQTGSEHGSDHAMVRARLRCKQGAANFESLNANRMVTVQVAVRNMTSGH